MPDTEITTIMRTVMAGDESKREALHAALLRADRIIDLSNEALWAVATSVPHPSTEHWTDIELEEPVDAEATRINEVLQKIYHHDGLHCAARARGIIRFAQHPQQEDPAYNGFCTLNLESTRRMSVTHRVPLEFCGRHRMRCFEIRKTPKGLYFMDTLRDDRPILVANDLRGTYLSEGNTHPFTALEVITSLHNTIDYLAKGFQQPDTLQICPAPPRN